MMISARCSDIILAAVISGEPSWPTVNVMNCCLVSSSIGLMIVDISAESRPPDSI